METNYVIHCDSTLCGLLACYSISRPDTWPQVSAPKMLAASSQVPPRVLLQHTKLVMTPIHRYTLYTSMNRPWHTDTHSHTHHCRHSSHWRNMWDLPWGMTPHWKHPAVTVAHTKLNFLKQIDKIGNQYLTSVVRAASHQKAVGWSFSQHTCHPLPPPPLILLTFTVLPSLFRELFALFITCFESSFYSLFVLLLFPVLVSHCVLSISLSLCESLLCWGVSAYIGLPVSVGVWFTRIFLTMTSTIVATFFPYGHCLSAVCVLLTADETHNRTESQAWNRNVLRPFFKLLSVHFSLAFQNMMVSVIK